MYQIFQDSQPFLNRIIFVWGCGLGGVIPTFVVYITVKWHFGFTFMKQKFDSSLNV